MSIATLSQFREFVRELTSDLDSPFQLALDAATSEANGFLGFDVEAEFESTEPPSDIVMACMLLAQVHADAGAVNDGEYRRAAAQNLLLPYRLNIGFGGA